MIIYIRKKTAAATPPPLPSFLAKQKKSMKSVPARVYTYDREIICFPSSFANSRGIVKIPKKKSIRDYLVINKLIGNIRLRSDMTESELMSEIRSVFKVPMDEDDFFRFKILQTSGGGSRSLSIREVSSSYKWTASTVAGKNSKCPIYILAVDDLILLKENCDDFDEYGEITIELSDEEVPKGKGKGTCHYNPTCIISYLSIQAHYDRLLCLKVLILHALVLA